MYGKKAYSLFDFYQYELYPDQSKYLNISIQNKLKKKIFSNKVEIDNFCNGHLGMLYNMDAIKGKDLRFAGVVTNVISLVVAATKGQLNINVAKEVATNCCLAFLKSR